MLFLFEIFRCKRRKTSLVEEHASENIPTSSFKRSVGSGNNVQLNSRSKRQSFGTDHLKNDRQVIEAEVLEIEELLDKSYEETAKKLAALRIIVEVSIIWNYESFIYEIAV